MNEPILIVMAAGMGSRYGGLKQMDPLGPHGEAILDYSVFDARRAGFKRVIFLIKHEIEADFKRLVGSRIQGQMDVTYAYQQLDRLPALYQAPAGRVKPWGTGHAVLCCREWIDAPFAVINADDYYGVEGFRLAYQGLTHPAGGGKLPCLMVGYRLENTLTDSGYVSRGVCRVGADGCLQDIQEHTHIIQTVDGPLYTEDGAVYRKLPGDTLVSMNLFGFAQETLPLMASAFTDFLDTAARDDPEKAEFYLPAAADRMIKAGQAQMRVLTSPDKWYGVTYQADKPRVKQALAEMTAAGVYPEPLWGE